MLHLYATARNTAVRETISFLEGWHIEYEVRTWNIQDAPFWTLDELERISDGLSMTQYPYHKGAPNSIVVSPRDKTGAVEKMEKMTREEQLAFLSENRKVLRGLITFDSKRGIAVSGYDEDALRVFLPREERRRLREAYLARVQQGSL